MAIPIFEQHLSFILGQPGRKVTAKQIEDGYILVIRRKGDEPIELHKQRGGIRVFRTLDSVGSLLAQRKVLTFSVVLMTKKDQGRPPWGINNEDDIPF